MKTRLAPILALAMVAAGCNQAATSSQTDTSSAASRIATTATVTRQDLVGYSFFDGKLVIPTSAQASAFSPYDTPVVSVSTSLGKHVERGEPIVKLQIPGADEAASAAKANAISAKSNLSDVKSVASGPVKAASQALDDARAAEKAAIDSSNTGGTADVAAATKARIDAEAALQDAQQKMKEAVQPAQDSAALSSVQLQAVKEDAAKGIVRAPISGTIVSIEAKPGMAAQAKQSLATIINYDAARVQGMVPAELKDVVIKNSRVIISMSGQNSAPIDGKVIDVTVMPPVSGQTTPGYLAVIELLNTRSLALPITSVQRVGAKTGKVKQALVVPVGALSVNKGKSIVKVQNGTDWVETPVETGLTDGAMVEIKSGLTEGSVVQVVTSPALGS